MTQQEQKAIEHRRPPTFERKNDYKKQLTIWAIRHFKEIYPHVYEKFKASFSPEECKEKIKEWAVNYANETLKSGHTWFPVQLDFRTTCLNSSAPALAIADVFGFVLSPQNDGYRDFVEIAYVDEATLRDFQDIWPDDVTLEEEVELWQEEVEDWPEEYKNEVGVRYAHRKIASLETQNNPCIFQKQTYKLSADAETVLKDCAIDSQLFTQGIYNPLQHQLHIEFKDILESVGVMTKHIGYTPEFKASTHYIVDTTAIGVQFNKIGDVITSANVADFCWSLVDCGKAVLYGISDGVIDVIDYALNNKTEMLLFVLCPTIMCEYYALKFQISSATFLGKALYAGIDKLCMDGKYFDECYDNVTKDLKDLTL